VAISIKLGSSSFETTFIAAFLYISFPAIHRAALLKNV
jgi:hypothetical protein